MTGVSGGGGPKRNGTFHSFEAMASVLEAFLFSHWSEMDPLCSSITRSFLFFGPKLKAQFGGRCVHCPQQHDAFLLVSFFRVGRVRLKVVVRFTGTHSVGNLHEAVAGRESMQKTVFSIF